jgi:hypothetical protein
MSGVMNNPVTDHHPVKASFRRAVRKISSEHDRHATTLYSHVWWATSNPVIAL